jgi:hypothetical protein
VSEPDKTLEKWKSEAIRGMRVGGSVILRSRALARRLEGWLRALVAYPSRLAEDGEHLRMTTSL